MALARAVLAAAVAAAGLAVAPAVDRGQAPAYATTPPRPLLALVDDGPAWRLTRVDPLTLQPLGGRRPEVMTSIPPVAATSPDGKRLVLGNDGVAMLDPVDLVRMRTAGPPIVFPGDAVVDAVWPRPRRLIVLTGRYIQSTTFLRATEALHVYAVDPVTRRAKRTAALNGTVAATARVGPRLVVLLGPARRIGGSRLVTIDARGGVSSIALGAIVSGYEPARANTPAQARKPGLAVDRTRARVFVVGTSGVVAEVDLVTRGVAYHTPSAPRSLLGRLRSWLEPAAQAKERREDSVRQLEWIGNGMLAVSGWDVDAEREWRVIPQGLSVIDTRRWTIRKADEQASLFWLAGGLLFTAAGSWDAAAQRWEASVEIYAADGTQRLSLVPRAPVVWVHAANGRAFVAYTQRGYSIFELASGRVLAEREQSMPVLLDVSG